MILQHARYAAAANNAALCRLNDSIFNPTPDQRRAVKKAYVREFFTLVGGVDSENASLV